MPKYTLDKRKVIGVKIGTSEVINNYIYDRREQKKEKKTCQILRGLLKISWKWSKM